MIHLDITLGWIERTKVYSTLFVKDVIMLERRVDSISQELIGIGIEVPPDHDWVTVFTSMNVKIVVGLRNFELESVKSSLLYLTYSDV